MEALNLNIITSAKIKATSYDQSTKLWTVKFQTPEGERTAISKHLVQATGVSSQKPYTPEIADEHLYKGVSLHSADFKNAILLKEKGVKVRLFPLRPFSVLADALAPSPLLSSALQTQDSMCCKIVTMLV